MNYNYSTIVLPTVETYDVDAAADACLDYVKVGLKAWAETLVSGMKLAAHVDAFIAGAEGRSQRGFVRDVETRWETGVSLAMVQRVCAISKALRANPDALRSYVEACDAPTISGAAKYLGGYAAPKPVPATATASDSPESADDEAQPTLPTRWDDDHVASAAKALLAALEAQGADATTVARVVAEAARLVTPVRSVKAA